MKITYCIMTLNRLHEVIQCIKRVGPYVDRIVVVDGGSTDDTILTLRNWEGVELYLHPWQDNFSAQRNNYLKHAGEDNGGTDWILVSDPDELYSEETCKNLKNEIERVERDGLRYNMIAFESNSVTLKGEKIVHKSEDKYWKALLFKWNPGIHYVGNPHETLIIDRGPRMMQSKYNYYHIKQDKMTWPRGARNAFIGGGGDNVREGQKLWKPLLDLVKAKTGITDWNSFEKYMIKGNIDQEIKNSFMLFKNETGYAGASEWREFYKTYFRIYHPEEEPKEMFGVHIE